ncbi:MAG: hypothetical protein IT406_00710 [Candidatus Yanofskybacteria bacterium]|nr:hypothetical protein [Candidatus Yanofskybacteria bacterium]
MDVYVSGHRIRLDPSDSIGKGGEADVFALAMGMAVKVFKTPDHPDLANDPQEQEGARRRIQEHQKKLRAFPKGLPPHVVVPRDLATDRSGARIVGYTMPLVPNAEVLMRYTDVLWRDSSGITAATVTDILRDLARTVTMTHAAHVVIGDFNDLNVLVSGTEAYLIDADSMQFGPFKCRVFTERFVDPLLCDPARSRPILSRSYTSESDWYAFAVMLMQCFLFVGPYAGVYRPRQAADRVDQNERPLRRITVFHPDVKRPKVMPDPRILPDDLLQFLHLTFEKDQRGAFPLALLEQMHWTVCPACKTVYARGMCPTCHIAPPAAIREVVTVRGAVTATRVFHTSGVILYATVQDGVMRWLSHANDAFRREDGTVILNGSLDPHMRFRISGSATLAGKGHQVATIRPGRVPEMVNVDAYGNLPIFDATAETTYWTDNGQLMRTDPLGPKYVGDVLAGQTLIWVGPTFGFGFYRAGQMQVGFVFDAHARGINDAVQLPKLNGHLVDTTCAFTREYCWFLASTHAGGVTANHCMVISRQGSLLATASAPSGDDSWLGTIRGHAAVGNSLLAATDEGVVRVSLDGASISVAQKFPDTEPFVHAHVHLYAVKDGLYAVGKHDVTLLRIHATQQSQGGKS